MTSFGIRLKELREQAGLTQEELGKKAGIHKLTVAKYEQGLREPTWGVIVSLSDALAVPCDAFRGEPGAPEPAKQGRGRPPNKKPDDAGQVEAMKPSRKKGRG